MNELSEIDHAPVAARQRPDTLSMHAASLIRQMDALSTMFWVGSSRRGHRSHHD
jgi:hypothetical protein